MKEWRAIADALEAAGRRTFEEDAAWRREVLLRVAGTSFPSEKFVEEAVVRDALEVRAIEPIGPEEVVDPLRSPVAPDAPLGQGEIAVGIREASAAEV